MNVIGKEYGKWLSTFDWTHIVTIRRHFRLTEFNIGSMMKRLFGFGNIKEMFYAIEPDRNDKMTHAHLLINSDLEYDSKRVAKELGVNTKSIRLLEEVHNAEAVSYYCTKHIKRQFSHHDFITK